MLQSKPKDSFRVTKELPKEAPRETRFPLNALSCENTVNQSFGKALQFKLSSKNAQFKQLPAKLRHNPELSKSVISSASKVESSSRRSQSQNWMPTELSELQRCANISD